MHFHSGTLCYRGLHPFLAGIGRISAFRNAMKGSAGFVHWEIAFVVSVIVPSAQLCSLSCQILSLGSPDALV